MIINHNLSTDMYINLLVSDQPRSDRIRMNFTRPDTPRDTPRSGYGYGTRTPYPSTPKNRVIQVWYMVVGNSLEFSDSLFQL